MSVGRERDVRKFKKHPEGCFLLQLFFFKRVFSGKVDSAFFVRAEEFDGYLVADGNNVLHVFNSLCVELGNVNESLFSGSDFNKRADGDDSRNRAGLAAAFNRLEYDGVDYALGNVGVFLVYGENED